ncbi:hypothetical protein BC834DRAFT_970180 [Gloeopeniophorella convolvens]|nr:hypothetical protein BC834DRAFT_970180 [Gloeopeniophorella convolvens]
MVSGVPAQALMGAAPFAGNAEGELGEGGDVGVGDEAECEPSGTIAEITEEGRVVVQFFATERREIASPVKVFVARGVMEIVGDRARVFGALLKLWKVLPTVQPYRMPTITPAVPARYVFVSQEHMICCVHTFHNCASHGCKLAKTRRVRQERSETSLREDRVHHRASPEDRILNLAQLRSANDLHPFRELSESWFPEPRIELITRAIKATHAASSMPPPLPGPSYSKNVYSMPLTAEDLPPSSPASLASPGSITSTSRLPPDAGTSYHFIQESPQAVTSSLTRGHKRKRDGDATTEDEAAPDAFFAPGGALDSQTTDSQFFGGDDAGAVSSPDESHAGLGDTIENESDREGKATFVMKLSAEELLTRLTLLKDSVTESSSDECLSCACEECSHVLDKNKELVKALDSARQEARRAKWQMRTVEYKLARQQKVLDFFKKRWEESDSLLLRLEKCNGSESDQERARAELDDFVADVEVNSVWKSYSDAKLANYFEKEWEDAQRAAGCARNLYMGLKSRLADIENGDDYEYIPIQHAGMGNDHQRLEDTTPKAARTSSTGGVDERPLKVKREADDVPSSSDRNERLHPEKRSKLVALKAERRTHLDYTGTMSDPIALSE